MQTEWPEEQSDLSKYIGLLQYQSSLTARFSSGRRFFAGSPLTSGGEWLLCRYLSRSAGDADDLWK